MSSSRRCVLRPSLWQHPEAGFLGSAANDLEGEVAISGGVHEAGAIIRDAGQQMLEPGPALADGGDDMLGAGAVGDVCGREIGHQQPAIDIDGDMAFVQPGRFLR